jgi:hypothetical protein
MRSAVAALAGNCTPGFQNPVGFDIKREVAFLAPVDRGCPTSNRDRLRGSQITGVTEM